MGTRFRWILTLAFGLGVAALPGPAQGMQDVIRIADEPSCRDCEIRFASAVTLVLPPDVASFTSFPSPGLARLSDGRYLAGPVQGGGVLAVFEADGSFLGVSGASGAGPGEFLGQPFLMTLRVAPSGTAYAFEGPYVHTLDEAGRSVARVTVPLRPEDAVAMDAVLALQAPVGEPDGHGSVVQVIREDGSIVSGIGTSPDRPLVGGEPFSGLRRLARGRESGTIWSAFLNRYEIILFDFAGTEVRRLHRDAPWFEPYAGFIHGELFLEPQRPRIEGLVESPERLLWVVLSQAPREFRPLAGLGGGGPEGGEGRLDPYMDLTPLLETTVEVLDPYEGALLARDRLPGRLLVVGTDDDEVLLYRVRAGEAGDLVIDLFRPSLGRPAPDGP